MARASKAMPGQDYSQTLNDAAASAAGNALRTAAAFGTLSGDAGNAATISQLARMCDEAASHMAQAQTSMFDGQAGGERAIEHLDAALQCLNSLADEGERHDAAKDRAAKSA